MESFYPQVSELNALIASNLALVVLVIFLLNLIVLMVLYNSNSNRKKLWQRYQKLMAEYEDKGLEQLLLDYGEKTKKLSHQVEELEELRQEFEKFRALPLQRWGLVRYNALQTMGGDLSFSLALLDGQANGVVITCIYGRDESRTFAKPIKNGTSSYTLSAEEKQALELALENS